MFRSNGIRFDHWPSRMFCFSAFDFDSAWCHRLFWTSYSSSSLPDEKNGETYLVCPSLLTQPLVIFPSKKGTLLVSRGPFLLISYSIDLNRLSYCRPLHQSPGRILYHDYRMWPVRLFLRSPGRIPCRDCLK